MFKVKYPSMFPDVRNGGYCVYHSLDIFCNMCSFENWEYHSDILQFFAGEY